jgi:hypothetical protein
MFRKRRTRPQPGRRSAHPQSAQLGVEQLETREVPATYRWNPAGDPDNRWNKPSNWDIQIPGGGWVSARGSPYPGQSSTTDQVEFWGGALSFDCAMNVPVTLYRMETKPGYGATINVNNPLTISGVDLNSMLIAKGEGTLRGLRPGGGITMAGQSTFEWNAGWLLDITVLVTRTDDARYARARVVTSASDRQQNNATLDVFGVLGWSGGNVQVAPTLGPTFPKSTIRVAPVGRFEINTAGQWGVTDPGRLDVVNEGTVTVGLPTAAAEASLVADYVTSHTTRIDKGILRVVGKAEQSAGTFVLAGATPADATARVLGNGAVLGIRGGSVVGIGTVDANLHLGNQDGTGAGTIAPGNIPASPPPPGMPPPPAPPPHPTGEIVVNQSFHLWSAGSSMLIDIHSATNLDKITVTGHAAFGITGNAGSLIVWVARTFINRPLGDKVRFLTAGGGIVRDFLATGVDGPDMWHEGMNGRVWATGKDGNSYYIVVEGPPPVGP